MEQGLILVVCTGNVCRSPLVERVLQAALDRRHGPGRVLVRSAGTMGLEGHPMDERSAALLADLGGSEDGFLARRLTPEMLAAAELVLTATRDHRARSVRLHPRALRRTFTVRELADILSRLPDEALPTAVDPAERLRELVRVAGDHRGLHLPDRPEDHDLVDPFRQEDAVYEQLRGELLPTIPQLRRGLGL